MRWNYQVTTCFSMFYGLKNITSIDLSNFDTSKVEIMGGLFMNCEKLKYVDLHNFSGSSLINFDYILYYCTSLMYVNLRNFIISNTEGVDISYNFEENPSNAKFCIEDSKTKNALFEEYSWLTFDCSDFCLQDNVYFNPEKNECYCKDYYKFKYDNICYHTCPENMFPTENNNNYICSHGNPPENYYTKYLLLYYTFCIEQSISYMHHH